MKHFFLLLFSLLLALAPASLSAQTAAEEPDTALVSDTLAGAEATLQTGETLLSEADEVPPSAGVYQTLKTKFIEGNAFFMSLVALALILGLAFCIERMVYLTLSDIDTRRFMADLKASLAANDTQRTLDQCLATPGPVAAICHQALLRRGESAESLERTISSCGSLQVAQLEKGCSWIRLFIAIAPSLGFLGTVIGMVMAFDQIQQAGDISPTIVASGMKVALITTIFGIVVALVLQLFYNLILSKIDSLTEQMEQSGIELLDVLTQQKQPS